MKLQSVLCSRAAGGRGSGGLWCLGRAGRAVGAYDPGAFSRPRGRRCCDVVVAAGCRAVPGYRDYEHLAEFLVDSAAGEAFVTSLVAAQRGAPELKAIKVVEANKRVTQAVGGAPLFAWVQVWFVRRRGRVFVPW